MDKFRLVSRLAELTGSLSPTEESGPDTLGHARRALAEALLNSQPEPMEDVSGPSFAPATLDTLPQGTGQELVRIAEEAIGGPREPSLRIFRRCQPVLTPQAPSSVPTWASGWSVEASIGAFESSDGGLVWFDVRRSKTWILVLDAQSGVPLMGLPRGTLPASPAPAGTTAFDIPAGSVWLAGALFDRSSPAGSFAGLRVRGGTLTLGDVGLVHGNVIGVRPGVAATLQLSLELPERARRARHGGDARKLSVELPERLTFALSIGAHGRLVEIAPATLELYGNRIRLRQPGESAPRYDTALARLWFPLSASADAISIDDARSHVFRPSGSAKIRGAGWALPVALPHAGNPENLGEAAGAGALAVSLASGLSASFLLPRPSTALRLESAFLLAEPAQLSVVAESAAARLREAVELWQNGVRGRSQVELESNAPLLVRFDATTAAGGAEALTVSALECRAALDRPVTAAGQRVPFISRRATLDVQSVADITRIAITAAADPTRDAVTGEQTQPRDLSFAMSNALTRTSAARALRLNGILDEQRNVQSGVLTLGFAVGFLLPSLPDPYAANIAKRAPRSRFDVADYIRAQELASRARWATPANPELSFELGAGTPVPPGFLQIDDAPIEREPNPFVVAVARHDHLPKVEARFPDVTGQGPELFRLLDVSSRADLFGIGYSPGLGKVRGSIAPLQLRGLELIAPTRDVSAFTLPAFHWEPVFNIPNEDAGPFPPKLVSPTDGGPTRFAMPAASLVPVAPLPVLDTFLTDYNHELELPLVARFTLPFGMVATAELRRGLIDPLSASPHFRSVRPNFEASGLVGGQQLMLFAPVPTLPFALGSSPGLPGATVQTNNSRDGGNVLKSGSGAATVDATFNDTFANKMAMVPVRRIDFSGYGATTFSDWRNPGVQGAGVTQVKFAALLGRTSREVVQVRSTLHPWGAIVVRTITMERTGSGGVFRRDSGWQAASDGDYKLPGCVVHAGVVPRLTNIRRIRDTTNGYDRAYPAAPLPPVEKVQLAQVVFDADVEIEGVTLGANPSRRVPTRDLVGYVQILPTEEKLTEGQLDDLLAEVGPIGGPIDCELNVAQSGLHMRLCRIEVDRTSTLAGNPELVAVARGSVELPSAGQWTVAFRGPSEAEPHRLEPDRPIPLIRANPAGGVVPAYRFAAPSELHRATSPRSEYALVHAAGAQRMLLPQPQVRFGDPTLHSGAALLFADMYTLGGGVALFPRPDLCHPLPAGSAMRITGRRKARLEIPAQAGLGPGEFKVGPLDRTLSQSAALRVRSRFRPDSTIKLRVDSDQHPDWSCSYGPVSVISDIEDLEEMMQVAGHLSSSTEAAPELRDAHMIFGGPLAPVQAIIDFLTDFGLPFPFLVSVTNSTFAFKSGTKFTFPNPGIAELVNKSIKQGPGVALHLDLVAGFGKESETAGDALEGAFPEAVKQSTLSAAGWHSYIECSAKLLVKTFELTPVLKAFLGGALKFKFAAKEHGKAEVTFCWGVSGAVELEVGILKISGGRTYSIVFRRMIGERKVGVGLASQWDVEGSLLAGLAAVKLSFELMVLLVRADNYHFEGEATLAIDVTLGWVFSKTFEVEIHMNETLAAAAFVAGTMLPIL